MMLHRSLKTILLRSTILVGATALSLPAVAQVTPGTPAAGNATPGVAAEAAPNPEGEREITVTGSLIKNPNLTRSAPVLVTTSEEIELRQSNVAEDVLREIPGITPSLGSAVNNGNGGFSLVDLRGIGANRNLVLLDGNRIVPATLAGEVDLNNIPLALVDRVESLTGAASTTYGADAISGVVNFITKQNFTGVDFSASEQITEKGDGNYYRTDLTIGGNFADDKGNAVLSVGYQNAEPVYQGDRNFSIQNLDSFNGTASGSSTSVPAGVTFQGGGRAATDPLRLNGRQQIDPAIGGIRNPAVGTYAPFNFNPYNIFQTPFKRFNIFAQAKYDVSDSFSIYTRGLFSKNTVSTIIAPSGVFASQVAIPLSNPFLPVTLRNQFCNNQDFDPATAGIQTLTPAQCSAAAVATNPTDPNFRSAITTLSRRTPEVGPRVSEYTTTVFDYKVGARGKFGDHLDWDVSGAYGESENLQQIQNYTLTSRVRSALYATNTATCLGGAPGGADVTAGTGCVPINLFGPLGSLTPAQIQYLTATSTQRVRNQLGQVHAQVSGDFGFTSPGATDPISFAVGGEYRTYKAIRRSDTLSQTAGELGGAGGAIPDITGSYNVAEGFTEVVAPLIQDKPGIQNLTLEGGYRYSSYKVNAPGNPKYNTSTYKGGGSYEPGFGLKFRGNYAHASRAPNIGELFAPLTTGLTNLQSDPCAGAAPTTNTNLRAVCLAQGAPAASIGTIQNGTAGQINSTSGGNINLRPEVADTYTGGVVFTPTFFRGFSVTADYYNIKVKRAVSNPTPQDSINSCFGNLSAASAADPACTIIRRNPATGGLDGDPASTAGIFQGLSNLGRIATEGVDVTFNYSQDVGFAKLGLSFLGNYTFNNRFQATPTSVNRDCIGFYSVNCGADGGNITGSPEPKFQWTQRSTLSFDSFDVSLLWRHIDALNQEPLDVAASGAAFIGVDATGATVNYGHIKPYDYFDLSTRISVMENLSLTLTAQNLGNRKPPATGSTIGSAAFNSGNTYPSTYDALGRRYAVTARVKF